MLYTDDRLPEEEALDSAEGAPPLWTKERRALALALLRPFARPFAMAFALLMAADAVALGLPLLTQRLMDHFTRTKGQAFPGELLLLLLIAIAATAVFKYLKTLTLARVSADLLNALRQRLYDHLQALPLAYFDRASSGNLTHLLDGDASALQRTLTDDLPDTLGGLLLLIGGLAMAFYTCAPLMIAVLAILGLIAGGIAIGGLAMRHLSRQASEALGDMAGTIQENITNIRLIKTFATEDFESRRVRLALARSGNLSLRLQRVVAIMEAIACIAFPSLFLGIVGYGVWAVGRGWLTFGQIAAFLVTVALVAEPLLALAETLSRVMRSAGAADRIFRLLDATPEDAGGAEGFPRSYGPPEITFHAVTFSYGDIPVLRGVSFTLLPGTSTALKGATGSGKSTITSLLLGLHAPQSGQIAIDGVPLSRISRRALRAAVGVVSQDVPLFAGTIRDNIRYGRPDATDEEVDAAARAANVSSFVEQFPDGYETRIGERGATLSGGQRQRIAIARALLKNPPLLILDEATSALDETTENAVQEALERLRQGRTTLIITHKPTIARQADRTLYLHAGRIVHAGRNIRETIPRTAV